MTNDPLDGLYAAQVRKESPLKRYGTKLAGGVACSAFVAVVMHLPYIKVIILWVCQIVILIFGRPAGVDKIEDKVTHIVEKGRQVAAHGNPNGGLIHNAIAPVRQAMEVKKTVENVVEKIEPIKEKAAEGVKTVKETGEKVVGALADAGGRAKEAVGGGVAGIAGLVHARSEAKDKAEREELEAQAAMIGFETDKEWTLPFLRAQMAQAVRRWQAAHGPNAQCPNPKCRHGMRINSKLAENRRCPRCGNIFSTRTALSLGPPPMRRPPIRFF